MRNLSEISSAKHSNTTAAIPTAFRVSVHGTSATETIKLRFEVTSNHSAQASLYAIQRYHQMHPSCEVCSIRVSKLNPKNRAVCKA